MGQLFRLDERTRPWWVLVGSCTGLFLLMLDSTIVSLALPSIQHDLGASAASLQWVMNGYLLVVAVLVVTAGRLGDQFGRRLVFLIGMVLFATGSVLAALSGDDEVLIAARVVQGAGAAAMLSLSLAIVCHAFPDSEQARALGIWAAVSAVALAIGPAVGGFLVDADWRLIFWINIPVSIAGIAIILIAAPESRDEEAGRQVDFPGLLTLTIGLGAAVLALVESDVWGWDDPRTPAVLLGGVAMLAAFWVIEHRVEDPIIDFSLFRSRPYLGATAAAFALAAAYWTVMFYQPQFLQEILGKSPVSAGLLVLPITVPMIAISPLSGRLIARFGARNLMTTGLLCGVAGLIFLTRIDADSSYAALMPGYLLFGIALGLVYAPMSTAAMAAMPRSKVGIASGVLAMARVLAGAVGLALSGAVFESLKSDKIASGEGDAVAFASALGDSSWVLVAIMALGTLGCWLLVPAKPDPDPDSAPGELQHRMHNKRFHL